MKSLIGTAPILSVAFGGLLLMIAEILGRPQKAESPQVITAEKAAPSRGSELGLLTAIVLLTGASVSAAVALAGAPYLEPQAWAPFLETDGFFLCMSFVLCVVAALAALQGGAYLAEHRIEQTEFFYLVIWCTVSAQVLVASSDLLSLYLAFETVTLGSLGLVALRRTSRSLEAAVKQLLLSGFASALMLFGMALLYSATGSTELSAIAESIGRHPIGSQGTLVLFGTTLLVVGLLFKSSIVPFHSWAIDVYEGAPTASTAFVSSVLGSSAIAVLLRVLHSSFGGEALSNWGTGWPPVLATAAVATLVFSSVVASRQSSVKRMLGYSSVGQMGYGLVAIVSSFRNGEATAAVVFVVATSALATCGAFGALMLCGSYQREATSYEDLSGLARRSPAVALALAVFLLSLAGVPLTAGFIGKAYVFRMAFEADLSLLAILAIGNAVIGSYMYIKALVYMYMRESAPGSPVAVPMKSPVLGGALVVAALLVLWIGVLPQQALSAASAASFAR